jgi:DNA-binding beta-propeller fold protein YncE
VSINPTTAAQGSVFQDVYLSGNNFFTTSTVVANSTPVPTTFLSTALLRARVPSCIAGQPQPPCPGNLLQDPGPTGAISLVVQSQSGATSSALNLTVSPVRPAIAGATPDSTPQGGTPTVTLDGGYYSPTTTAEFNGQSQTAQLVSPRQLNVTIPATATTGGGLFPLVLHNSGAAQPVNGVNLAIQPPVSSSPTTSNLAVGSRPSAVAVDTALGKAVVTNQGTSMVPGTTVSVIDLASQTATSVTVGSTPTGVAVDNVRHIALVVNNGSSSANISIVNLAANPPTVTGMISGVGTAPFAVGINPLTGHGIVVDQSTNSATVIDLDNLNTTSLRTAAISTGPNPAVVIEPRLDWAIVTPGGLGSLSIVDLSHFTVDSSGNRSFSIVATLAITGSTQGIGLNTETDQVLLTDPSHTVATVFSLLDQTTSSVTVGPSQVAAAAVAAAVNPLTNIGVTANNLNNTASIIDLGAHAQLATVAVGTSPVAVAIDPTTDTAVVVNQGSNNVTLIPLGALKPLQIIEISPATTCTTAGVATTNCASASALTLTVIGNGFTANSRVRLDENILTTNLVGPRQLTATVPAAMLTRPARYLVDVQDGTNVSNLMELTVIEGVPLGANTAPQGVAIGHITVSGAAHSVAVVTNTGSNNISVVDLANPASCPIAAIAPQCVIAVGASPQGVAILERAVGANGTGKAVVTNFSDNTATIVDLTTGTAAPPVAVGGGPIGVAINPDTGIAVVANSSSNSLSLFSVDTGAAVGTAAVDQRPVAVAIDPSRNLAAVANATQNTVDLVDLSAHLIVGRIGPPSVNLQVPSGVAFDPVSDVFVVANSLLNNLDIVDPATSLVTPVGIGINPTSVAYNFQSSTLVTVNTASKTASVMDLLSRRVRAVLSMNGSPQSSVAVDPQSNLAAIVDQVNNQLLLVPLPR